jgi:hypothetical protein
VDGFLLILSALLRYALLLAVLWVIDSLLAALAFRVNLGAQPLPMERAEYAWRSALAGLGLALYVTLAFALADFLVVVVGGGESGDARWLGLWLLLPYPVAGVFLFSWAFAMDDLLEGFKVFVIHHLPPLLLLFLLGLAIPAVGSFFRQLVS